MPDSANEWSSPAESNETSKEVALTMLEEPVNCNGKTTLKTDLRLRFSDVSYTSKKNNVKILNDCCGEFRSGRLTAILGPSGAGKTSMLNVLSAFKASDVTGQFTLNGQERNLLSFRKLSSYIPQEFAMLDLLSVQESLRVSTDLKLPAKTSVEEKHKIIDNILQLLNMNKCRHTLLQDLSGGERKRLSIGIELVTNPPVMFFDEPTSGLDSFSSLQVMNHLRRLAHDGRIIVCVVHQPSSRLMRLFDDVLVMSQGEVLYSGPQSDMISHFAQAGFMCPNYYNPADFVLEVGSDSGNPNISVLVERNKELHHTTTVSSRKGSVDEESPILEKHASQSIIEMNQVKCLEPQKQQQEQYQSHCSIIRPKTQVSTWRQFCVLTSRSFRCMSRNRLAVQMRVIMHVVIAVLIGVVFWDIGNDGAKVLSNSSCIFFVVMFVFFGNAMPSILLCPLETAVFLREYFNGWYSLKSYYMAKIIADIPMQFACPTVLIVIVYHMTGQPDDMARFAMCWGICLMTAMMGHFMGLIFGSIVGLQMAVFLVPTIAIPFMIFSGFFIRMHELASFLRPICDISFFRYTMEGFIQAIYGYGREDLICSKDFCYFKSPQKFLKEMDMLGEYYGKDLLALLLWVVAFKLFFFLSCVWRIKRAQ